MPIASRSGRQPPCRPARFGQGAALLAAALSLSLLVAGCWDRTEINELAIVFASAVDYEDGQWINTAGFIRTASQGAATGVTGATGGGSGGGGPARFTVTVQAPTIREAHAKLALFVSRRIHWDHATAVLVGEQAARKGIEPVLDLWTRETDLRTTALVFLTRGKAEDVLLAAQPGMEASLGQGLTRLADVAGSVGLAQPIELHSLVTQLASESHTAVVPLIALVALPQPAPPDTPAAGDGKGGSQGSRGGSSQGGSRGQGIGSSLASSGSEPAPAVQQGRALPPSVPAATLQIQGAGVFREGRLVTLLSPSQVRGLLWVTSPSQEIVVSVRLPQSSGSSGIEERDAPVAVVVESAKPSLKVRPDQASIRLQVQVRLIEQDSWHEIRTPSGIRARGAETDMSGVAAAVSRQIEQEIRSVLKATQPLGADVYSLAGVLHRQNKEAWHEVESRWPQILRTLPVTVNVETRVVGTGESISPPVVRFEGRS